ncbi:MAG: hypothetical protein K2H01_06145, partial [Ruminococcus sp.]|nr:hypothetical protein [Ruminococcus sp.]
LYTEEVKDWQNKQVNYELASQYNKKTQKEARKLHKIVENYVREDFGYKKIGEHWVTETMLFHIISQIFPNYKVIFHYRPQILEGLEIDIFISEINLGIEYQGIQHFKPIDFWGGEEALKKTQQHDEKKKLLCQQLGIDLIYFYFYDNINELLVKERLKKYLNR